MAVLGRPLGVCCETDSHCGLFIILLFEIGATIGRTETVLDFFGAVKVRPNRGTTISYLHMD